MGLERKHLYHPFPHTYLGIFSRDSVTSETLIGGSIEDIDLYQQPVQEPLIATMFLVIKLSLLVAGEYLFIKVYKLMKKENGITKEITQLNIYVQLFFWPFWILFADTTAFIYPMKDVIGEWYCYLGSFVFYFLGNIIISHSFISALIRYFFILHQDKVNLYGKQEVKRFFLLLSILLPLLLALWKSLHGYELDSMSFVNKCHGKHHQVFLIDSSTMNVAKRNFCAFEFDHSGGIWTKMLAQIRQILCFAHSVVQLVLGLNVAEGVLYYKILSHMNSEHENSMKKLRKLLSDDQKNRRSRRNGLSIQITILGWLVEWVAFFTLVVGSYILGNKNNTVTMTLQCVTMFFYVIFLPGSLLINSSEVKERIAESDFYLDFTTKLGCKPTIYLTPEEEDDAISIRRRSDADLSTGQHNASSEGQSTSYSAKQNVSTKEENVVGSSNVRSIENETNSARNAD